MTYYNHSIIYFYHTLFGPCHVGSCHIRKARPRIADGGDGL